MDKQQTIVEEPPHLIRNISAPLVRIIPIHPSKQRSTCDQHVTSTQMIPENHCHTPLSLQIGASIVRSSTAPPAMTQSVLECMHRSIDESINHTRFSPAEVHLLRLRKFQYMNALINNDCEPVEILPRLYLGSIGGACNVNWLQQHSITHILNIGNHLPTFHESKFDYLKLIVQDAKQEDISQHFERCLRFIERGRGGLVSFDHINKNEYAINSVDTLVNEDNSCVYADDNTSIGTGVLLHCFAGRSRSVTILLAYLLTLVHSHPNDHVDVVYIHQAVREQSELPSTSNSVNASSTRVDQSTDYWSLPDVSPPTITPGALSLKSLFDFVKHRRREIKPNIGFIHQLLYFERELILLKQQQDVQYIQHNLDDNILSHSNVDEEWRELTN